MSKIGQPSGPRLPNDAPAPDGPKAGEGSGQGTSATPAPAGGQQAKRVLSAGDVERLASQAGYARTGGKKKGRGFDVGDGAQAPIPLPEDDLDPELTTDMSFGGLEAAQGQLLHHSARLGRSRRRGDKQSLLEMWQAIVSGEGEAPDGEGLDEEAMLARTAALQGLPAEPGPDAAAMAKVASSVAEHFQLDLSQVPVGPQLMAASLLVAGQRDDVAMVPGGAAGQGAGLDGQRLLTGAGRVIDDGRQAAEDAHSRAAGMQQKLNLQRTFVPKR